MSLRLLTKIALLAGIALVLQPTRPAASSPSLLVNGGFEQWSAEGKPVGWTAAEATVAQTTSPDLVAEGSAAAHLVSNGNNSSLWQWVAVAPGARYTFAGKLRLGSAPQARLRIDWKKENGDFIDSNFSAPVTTPGSYQIVEATAAAPAEVAFAMPTVVLIVDDVGQDAYLDALSFGELASPPDTATPAPASTDTPLPSPTEVGDNTPVPSQTPPASATADPPSTPPPAAIGTALPSPSPTTTPPDNGSGGMLRNGDFEREADGAPADWRKYGGTLSSTTARVHAGGRAALLESSTDSTKWLYQSAAVTGGDWYAFRAYVSMEDSGEAFLRVSWYSSPDGSGSSSGYDESLAAAGPTGGFVLLDTGPVQAPPDANSVRARIVLRPGGSGPTSMVADDARMEPTSPPPPTPPATTAAAPATPASQRDEDGPSDEPSSPAAAEAANEPARSPTRPSRPAFPGSDEGSVSPEQAVVGNRPQRAAATTTPAPSAAPKPTATLFSQVSSARWEPPAATAQTEGEADGLPPWLWMGVTATTTAAAGAAGYALYKRRRS